jgi:LuxR family transcriptional regulator, maltose regulon positive regulatory protein
MPEFSYELNDAIIVIDYHTITLRSGDRVYFREIWQVISGQLLQTKLVIPQLRPALVSRPRLIERLNAGIDSTLILVSAPAGFGKTTLVRDWISNIRRPVAWLSLDDGDNDPVLFLEYLVAALRKINTKIGASALRLFRSSQQFPAKAVLTDLINDICSLSDHFVLVLDDYHVIQNKNIHNALNFLMENMPPNLHLVILTRSDPPLHLSHLRGRGQIIELRAIDLRFTLEEGRKFLNQVMKLNLSEEEISSLDARSEGWIAGLQMAAISLKGRTDTTEFIDAFSGSNRNILDYLFEEVFERQTEDIKSFLLETSILEQLTGPLCDAVTHRNDSSKVLEAMKKANLFVISLDEIGRWYRYHRLFADLLKHSLKNFRPQIIADLYKRASLWYEQNGLAGLAIEHALAGHDFVLAASLIERNAEATLTYGEMATLRRWIGSLPEENVRAKPVLMLFQVLAELWLHSSPLKRGEAQLREAAELDPRGQLAGQVLAVQAILAAAKGDTHQSVELAHRSLAILSPESTFWRRAVAPCLGQFSLLRGELPEIPTALNLFSEAIQMARETGNLFSMVLALRRLAEVNIAAGHLRESQACYQQIIDLAVDSQGKPLPLASFGMIGLGSLAREWHDLDQAAALLDQGIHLASGKLGLWQLEGYVNLAHVRNSQGNTGEARKLIQNARQLTAESTNGTEFAIYVTVNEIVLFLRQGNLEATTEWARELSLGRATGPELTEQQNRKTVAGYYSSELEQITLARVYLAQGRPGDSLKVLEPMLKPAEKMERTGIIIEILVLEALAYQALGAPDKAVEFLQRSLSLAEPEGYISLFVDEGKPMARLLYTASQKRVQSEYIRRLLAILQGSEPEPYYTAQRSKTSEPLSDREVDVLKLLAQGLANKEIASQLYIELRTVKWHTGNIFGKLSVKNRTQAVTRARELNILPR